MTEEQIQGFLAWLDGRAARSYDRSRAKPLMGDEHLAQGDAYAEVAEALRGRLRQAELTHQDRT